jgi:hypothetical protein
LKFFYNKKLLEDKDNNIIKLEEITSNKGKHLISLAIEWEKHRKPMIEKYRKLKFDINERKENYKKKLDLLKENRNAMKSIIVEIKQKEELIKQLQEEFNSLPKNLERQSFVFKILDVVKNIENQKLEINKYLLDNKRLEGEIPKLENELNSIFSQTENLVYLDSKKEETSKQTYENLVQMKNSFNDLRKFISERGTTINNSRDLEIQIEHITERNLNLNIERVKNDLLEIKKENEKLRLLVKQLKEKNN